MIPKQFHNPEFRFIRIMPYDKRPQAVVERKEWKKDMLPFDHPDLVKWVEQGNNVAVVGGYGGLRIIDCDGGSIPSNISAINTFIVKTPKKGYHVYLINDDDENFDNEELNIEYRALDRYVLIPPSIHPDTRTPYEVFSDKPIIRMSVEEADELLSPKKKDTSRSAQEMKEVCKLIREGKTKEEIFYLMNKIGEKWKTAHLQYKELTYKKASVWVKDHPLREKTPSGDVYEKIYQAAKEVSEREGIIYDKDGVFWVHSEQDYCYIKADETEVLSVIKDKVNVFSALEPKFRLGFINALKLIGRERSKGIRADNDDFYKYTVQFRNMLYSGISGNEKKATKDDFTHNSIPWDPIEGETLVMDRLFNEWTNGKAETLKDILAYSCIPNNSQKLIFFYVGQSDSGKTQFQGVIKRFLGAKNCVSTNLTMLANQNQRFEVINLRHKLAVFAAEIDDKVTYNTAMLKRVSGNDDLRGEYKGISGIIDFRFGGKGHIITNTLPVVLDESDTAYFGRTVVIDFPNKFERTDIDILDTIPREEYNYLAAYCLKRIKEWFSKKTIDIIGLESRDLRAKKYLHRTDLLAGFVSTHMDMEQDFEPDTQYRITMSKFASMFNEYLLKNGQKEWDPKRIGRALVEKYPGEIEKYQRRDPKDENSRWWEYRGIRPKDPQKSLSQVSQLSQDPLLHFPTYRNEIRSPVTPVTDCDKTLKSLILVALGTGEKSQGELLVDSSMRRYDTSELSAALMDLSRSGDIITIRPGIWKLSI